MHITFCLVYFIQNLSVFAIINSSLFLLSMFPKFVIYFPIDIHWGFFLSKPGYIYTVENY